MVHVVAAQFLFDSFRFWPYIKKPGSHRTKWNDLLAFFGRYVSRARVQLVMLLTVHCITFTFDSVLGFRVVFFFLLRRFVAFFIARSLSLSFNSYSESVYMILSLVKPKNKRASDPILSVIDSLTISSGTHKNRL